MVDCIAIIGAGNGGKAAAVDLAPQGKRVHLFEFPEFRTSAVSRSDRTGTHAVDSSRTNRLRTGVARGS